MTTEDALPMTDALACRVGPHRRIVEQRVIRSAGEEVRSELSRLKLGEFSYTMHISERSCRASMHSTDDFRPYLNDLRTDTLDKYKSDDDKIIAALLDYTHFAKVDGDRPEPFDDPFVGAALFTTDYQLLGAYRKRNPGERHSEPEALLQALKGINSGPSDDLHRQIEEAYARRLWLQNGGQPAFEALFKKAGATILGAHQASGLVIFSSLEPCGSYEAQPSCSHIICACGVRRVLYASDDINPKGMGRPVLANGGIDVRANVAPDKAVRINNLFFATTDICNRAYSDYSFGRLFSGAPYSLFRSDGNLFGTSVGTDERLVITPKSRIDVSYVQPEHAVIGDFVTSDEVSEFQQGEYDPDATFFYGGDSAGELSKLLFQHSKTLGFVPGRIVTTRDPLGKRTPDRNTNQIVDIIREKARLHANAFRKHSEVWTAHRHLILANFRGELRNHLSVLLKINPTGTMSGSSVSPYLYMFCSAGDAHERLLSACRQIESDHGYVSRLTLLANTLHWPGIRDLLLSLRRLFERNRPLARASVQVGLVDQGRMLNREIGSAAENLRSSVKQYPELSARVEFVSPRKIDANLTVAHLEKEIRHGRRDAQFFDQDYLDSLAASTEWLDRKYAGTILSRLATGSGEYARRGLLEKIVTVASQGLTDESWTTCCSKLNAVRDARDVLAEHHKAILIEALEGVASAIEKVLSEDPTPQWVGDVAWRWLACWFEAVGDTQAPVGNFRFSALAKYVANDEFLLASAVQYGFRCAKRNARDQLAHFLGQYRDATSASISAPVALGRLLAAHCADRRIAWSSFRAWTTRIKCWGMYAPFRREYRTCKAAAKFGLPSLELNPTDPSRHPSARLKSHLLKHTSSADDFFRSYVALRTLRGELGGSSPSTSEDSVDDSHQEKAWREDHRTIIAETLSFLPNSHKSWALLALSVDTDVSIRWATLFLAMNSKAIADSIAPDGMPAGLASVAALRAEVVDSVRATGPHYWLEREIFRTFVRAHQGVVDSSVPSSRASRELRPDIPSAARLKLDRYIFAQEDKALHPELKELQSAFHGVSSRILLVLPPVSWPPGSQGDDSVGGNQTSPALGLGQIAAALSSAGHFVRLVDAHRFRMDLSGIAQLSREYEYVGISSVFSTVKSTLELAAAIDRAGSASTRGRPRIIIGGHAPTLNQGQFLSSLIPFDYLVIGPGEIPFVEIVDHHKLGRKLANQFIIAASEVHSDPMAPTKGSVRRLASEQFAQAWDTLPLIDRTTYAASDGASYEPSLTRNNAIREAHFVMSKGCDWKCTFCTEAVLTGPREIRRSARGIVEEVSEVCREFGSSRAQFIDDNVFPPIAAPGLSPDEVKTRVRWAREFLNGLRRLRDSRRRGSDSPGSEFSWRGLVRLEDLSAYVDAISDFESLLQESGCALLAFGVEHGNESVRHQLKAGDRPPSNGDIKTMVNRLHAKGILTKAYFMMGGRHDSETNAVQTIDFALELDVDLAYFAIYKDFREIATKRREGGIRGEPIFESFEFDLSYFCDVSNAEAWGDAFGANLLHSPEVYKTALRELKTLNFNFSALFKYNDVHADDLAKDLYFGEGASAGKVSTAYFRLLRRAYLEFYARARWVNVYRRLLDTGY